MGVLQLSTVIQLDNHTRQLLKFLNISSNSFKIYTTCQDFLTYRQTHSKYIQRVKLRLSYGFPRLLGDPMHFLQKKWIASSFFVYISSFSLECPCFLPACLPSPFMTLQVQLLSTMSFVL